MDVRCEKGLRHLPKEAAMLTKVLATNASWKAANQLSLFHGRCAHFNGERVQIALDDLLECHILSESACNVLKDMTIATAEYAANARMGDRKLSIQRENDAENLRDELIKTGEIHETLARKLITMCAYSSWHASNMRKFGYGLFHRGDAARDAKRVKDVFKTICDRTGLKGQGQNKS